MKRSILSAGLSLGFSALLLGCSDPNGSSDSDGDDNEKAGSSGTGTGGGGTGGAGSGAGGGGTGGNAGSGGVMCVNPPGAALPIDESGWVARECNDHMIQGAFYCYDDEINETSCPAAAADGTRPPPYRAGSMCISGSTTVDPTYAAWGAGLGLSLNDEGAPTFVKSAYNAAANGVTGFNIGITGDTGGRPLRVGFTGAAMPTGAQPFVEFAAGTTNLEVLIQDALVPATWTDPNAGMAADPASIYDLQVQIPGGDVATTYDFCISSITPIAPDGPVGGTLMPYGMQQCGNLGTVELPGRYMVQNNLYNAQGGTQCLTAAWDMGANAGFVVNPMVNVPAGNAPASYPSIVLGWHYGRFYGSYTAARQLGTLTSIPSSWTFTAPPSGRYNASYDAWLHPTNANPSTPGGGLELMIWTNYRTGTTPIGTVGPTVEIGGASWAVWYGPNAGGWNTVSYVRSGNTSSITNLNLIDFFVDAVTRGYATTSTYLLGIQAGFEIWEQNQPMTTNSYTIAIN